MAERERIRFFPYEEVRRIADDYSNKHSLSGIVPVDVELLVDNVLRINVIPFPSLCRSFDVNAFISNDLRKIYVDEHLYENYEPQYRFTLAHELGPMVLHGAFYKQFKIESLAAYVDFVSGISEDEYRLIKTQANDFAGLFLVPASPLRTHFMKESLDIIHFLSSRFRGLSRDKYLGQAAELIARRLSSIFNVHYLPIQIRIGRDKLTDLIP